MNMTLNQLLGWKQVIDNENKKRGKRRGGRRGQNL
jgi:hypothetical protein